MSPIICHSSVTHKQQRNNKVCHNTTDTMIPTKLSLVLWCWFEIFKCAPLKVICMRDDHKCFVLAEIGCFSLILNIDKGEAFGLFTAMQWVREIHETCIFRM